MRYNFKRVSGTAWYELIKSLRDNGTQFIKLDSSAALYDSSATPDITCAYFFRTTSSCKLIYYEFINGWKKRFREISFSSPEVDALHSVLTFKKISSEYGELEGYEPENPYTNGVYSYFSGAYKGYVTVLDMNSAYLYALGQPLADWKTRTEVSVDDVFKKEFDYYSFENGVHRKMFYKDDFYGLLYAVRWLGTKVYGYKARLHYQRTVKELYRLRQTVNKQRYKNVANIAIGCMHKNTPGQNNQTLAASLYAFFEYNIQKLVDSFEKKGYNVIMVNTDSIKIKGRYNPEHNLVTIGDGLGEWKVEYEGEAQYVTEGRYVEDRTKWKGMPQYIVDGHSQCKFIENIEEEKPIYEKYYTKRT